MREAVAKGLHKSTIAECVEDQETLEMLKGFGVDSAQGYHFEKPQDDHPMMMTMMARRNRELPLGT